MGGWNDGFSLNNEPPLYQPAWWFMCHSLASSVMRWQPTIHAARTLASLQWLCCPNFTYCQWLTLSGTFPLVLILKFGWVTPRLIALPWLGGCKINPSASDSIPAPSATPCSLHRVERDMCLWKNDRAAQLSSRHRADVFPEVLVMQWEYRLLLEHCLHRLGQPGWFLQANREP